jgi:hypothetical protein
MSNANWYANKLGTTAPRPTPPIAPPVPTPFNPQPQVPQGAPQEAPRLPQSAVNATRCPGCGSGNYGSVTPESKARCYDCGYPLIQAGSGVSGVGNSATGPTMPARQSTTANNFNPQGIIGHI